MTGPGDKMELDDVDCGSIAPENGTKFDPLFVPLFLLIEEASSRTVELLMAEVVGNGM